MKLDNYQFKLVNGCGNVAYNGVITALSSKNQPFVITPNNDGINEVLEILAAKVYPNNELIIYNRLGQLIYHQKSYTNNFDGLNLTEGTYIYIFKYVDENNKEHTLRNTISIIR